MENKDLLRDARTIYEEAIQAVLPDEAVRRALQSEEFNEFSSGAGRLVAVSFGKAGWQMAKAACDIIGDRMTEGIVITKYGHVMGEIPGFRCFEAGHPLPDENSLKATEEVTAILKELTEEDRVLLLISGGGSALLEQPMIGLEELEKITGELLASGADIREINTIRKHLSHVKGGRLAETAYPAEVFSVVLSDIIGDPLDMIASGPAYPDPTTSEDAKAIAGKYGLELSESVRLALEVETPKKLDNVYTMVTGSVTELVKAAASSAKSLGYSAAMLSDSLDTEAKYTGEWLAGMAKNVRKSLEKDGGRMALICGGETVVKVTGKGKGGRNQELALSAAKEIDGEEGIVIFSVGSDGTDGPTDAAGGIVDGETAVILRSRGIDIDRVLHENDSYNALKEADALIFTGPTGTNVNDLAVALVSVRPKE